MVRFLGSFLRLGGLTYDGGPEVVRGFTAALNIELPGTQKLIRPDLCGGRRDGRIFGSLLPSTFITTAQYTP